MTAPVDLTNLRSMTDGDSEMERELFAEFKNTFVSGIDQMTEATSTTAADVWASAAHALKGVALNLGAGHLSDLCKQAQDDKDSPHIHKSALLEAITAEYNKVQNYLDDVTSLG